ncbi:Uncharacterised protein [Mycobacteroides abscessus]|nr:Uncharacterised protein [Mycobacteroides abscessus]CPZ54415.1 Uncharacterised protein [Mycobacteroides abscessus]
MGASTKAWVSLEVRSIFDRIGIANAAVFPVPVCARPTTSEPANSGGMVAAWMAEGVSYPTSDTARSTSGAMCRSAKVTVSSAGGALESPVSGVGISVEVMALKSLGVTALNSRLRGIFGKCR